MLRERTSTDELDALIGAGVPDHLAGLPTEALVASIRLLAEELREIYEGGSGGRPWSDLRETGLLWLINKVVFHPRGFRMGVNESGTIWTLLGDGSEPWSMGADIDEDALFARVKALLG